MREDYGNISLVTNDDGFGDMGFDTDAPDLMRHTAGLEPSIDQSNLLFSDGPVMDNVGLDKDKEPIPSTSGAHRSHSSMEVDTPIRDDGFGGNLDQNIISGGLFEGGLFDDAPMPDVPAIESSSLGQDKAPDSPIPSDDDMDHFGGPPSVGGHSSDNDSRPGSALDGNLLGQMPPPSVAQSQEAEPVIPETHEETQQDNANADQTTLLHNEEESFALAPVDASALKGTL